MEEYAATGKKKTLEFLPASSSSPQCMGGKL